MSILETISKVRETETEADRIIEEAHRQEQEAIAEALRQRKEILEDARRLAGKQIEELRERITESARVEMLEIERDGEARKEDLRALASRNREAALERTLQMFSQSFLRGGD